MADFRKILVPVDYSEMSARALDQALGFAERFDAQVEVLHVWEVPAYVRPDLLVWAEGTEEHRMPVSDVAGHRAAAEMQRFLDRIAGPARARITEHLRAGDPVETILEVAADGHADLIVMGTRGRTGLSHLVMGSVAESVLRRATCPVLTVRAAS